MGHKTALDCASAGYIKICFNYSIDRLLSTLSWAVPLLITTAHLIGDQFAFNMTFKIFVGQRARIWVPDIYMERI